MEENGGTLRTQKFPAAQTENRQNNVCDRCSNALEIRPKISGSEKQDGVPQEGKAERRCEKPRHIAGAGDEADMEIARISAPRNATKDMWRNGNRSTNRQRSGASVVSHFWNRGLTRRCLTTAGGYVHF